jgi:hypothetical protein
VLPPVAASGTIQANFIYDYLYSTYGVYDPAIETVVRGSMVASVAWTAGDAITLNHYNSAGATVDAVSIATTAAAHIPVDFTASTASTGNRINQGWTMTPGDSIELVVAATTTAGTRGGVGVVLLIDTRGA